MSEAVAAVGAVLSLPEGELDYARAKIAFDRIVDPSIDEALVLAELDRLTEAARELAGASANDATKLNALRKVIYESGPWNGHRPFSYDHEDFKALRCKLLANYLQTRLGNCVSMPVLFLILADRLGLNVALAFAPGHLFVRYRKGAVSINLEATGTALPARDQWYRQELPMSDRAVTSGFCLRTLGRGESVAAMATTILEHLAEQHRFDELVAACETVLRCNPRDGATWARRGHACYIQLWHEYLKKYSSAFLIPAHLRARHDWLIEEDYRAFRQAEALGWEPPAEMAVLYERFADLPEIGFAK